MMTDDIEPSRQPRDTPGGIAAVYATEVALDAAMRDIVAAIVGAAPPTGGDVSASVVSDPNDVMRPADEALDAMERDIVGLRNTSEHEVHIAADWERQAMLAVSAGNDFRAREAVARWQRHMDEARRLHDSADQLTQTLGDYRIAVEELRRRLTPTA